MWSCHGWNVRSTPKHAFFGQVVDEEYMRIQKLFPCCTVLYHSRCLWVIPAVFSLKKLLTGKICPLWKQTANVFTLEKKYVYTTHPTPSSPPCEWKALLHDDCDWIELDWIELDWIWIVILAVGVCGEGHPESFEHRAHEARRVRRGAAVEAKREARPPHVPLPRTWDCQEFTGGLRSLYRVQIII